MKESIIEKIKKTKLIKSGDTILVGFSGGPDSVCLLTALHEIAESFSLTIYAAHLNHNLRGMESNEDASFAVNFSRKHNIACVVKSIEVAEYASRTGVSLEMAGRICRYRFFEEVAEKIGIDKIAVGHHLNDQAETLLMNLIRGSGLEGLTGIPAVRKKIIRPLIHCRREEIIDFCHRRNLPYRIDATNQETEFFRNKIRNRIIPDMETCQPSLMESMGRTIELLEQDRDYIEEVVEAKYQDAVRFKMLECISLDYETVSKEHPAVASRILRRAYHDLEKTGQTVSFSHIKNVMENLRKGTYGKEYQLPGKIIVKLKTEEILFAAERYFENRAAEPDVSKDQTTLKIPGITHLLGSDSSIYCEVLRVQKVSERNEGPYCQIFDQEKLPQELVVRTRSTGDRIKPLGMEGTKKLKDFFIDQKIPAEERDRIVLLAHENEIFWVVGHRISDRAKVTTDTQKVVRMQYRPGKEKTGCE
ncbi:MAG: tRNA lysidine(34) synthetase TilS [Tindallia sp. MSAO_Bac2]|nr:MAG: tRNA lysidine(34) synthetase TilS [Tindallia sp. MSAO_Bac2]